MLAEKKNKMKNNDKAKRLICLAIAAVLFIVALTNTSLKIFEIATSEWFDAFSDNCRIVGWAMVFTVYMTTPETTEKQKIDALKEPEVKNNGM